MFKIINKIVVQITTLLLLICCSCSNNIEKKLIIATAANTKYAIEEIGEAFNQETGYSIQVISGSSGKHTAQIIAGAPYDVFISADLLFPDKLNQLGLTVNKPEVFAYGKLVLWSLSDSITIDMLQLEGLNKPIAIPNPKTAPYGRAAKEALEHINIYDKLSPNLVFGESVGQTNQFIISKAVAIGITAASSVMNSGREPKGRWKLVDETTYTPIVQGAVVLKQSQHLELANKFYLFLFSAKARNILASYGYNLDKTSK